MANSYLPADRPVSTHIVSRVFSRVDSPLVLPGRFVSVGNELAGFQMPLVPPLLEIHRTALISRTLAAIFGSL